MGFSSVLRRQDRELAQLEGAKAKEFLRLVRDSKDLLEGRFLRASQSQNPLDAFKARALIVESEAAIRSLERQTAGDFIAVQQDAVALGHDHLFEEIDRLSDAIKVEQAAVDVGAQVALADPIQGLLANSFESSVQRYGIETLNAVRRDIFLGMRAGDSTESVTKRVFGRFGALGDNSPLWKTERLVRTEVMHAYSIAQQTSMERLAVTNPSLRKKWKADPGGACGGCADLDDQIRPVSGTWLFKNKYEQRRIKGPPAHPNCRCRSVMTSGDRQ